MKTDDIKIGDILANVDQRGCGYYKVLNVNRITIDVQSENGNTNRCYPNIFSRKATYPVRAFHGEGV